MVILEQIIYSFPYHLQYDQKILKTIFLLLEGRKWSSLAVCDTHQTHLL